MRWLIFVLLALSHVGCHREYIVREPVTAEQIIELTRQGHSPEEIIRKIDRSRTIYVMDSQDIVNLSKKGVDQKVIDHMMETHRRDLRRRRYYDDRVYFYPHPYIGFGWWGPYW